MRSKKRNMKTKIREVTTLLMPIVFTVGMVGYWLAFKTSNENIAFSAIYCDCCKHKWTAIKYINKNGKWIKTDFYKRFDTLDELKEFVENYEEAENKYYFSEDNRESLPEVMDRSFTTDQLKEVYRDITDKTEYHDFQEWFFDMLRSGLILYI